MENSFAIAHLLKNLSLRSQSREHSYFLELWFTEGLRISKIIIFPLKRLALQNDRFASDRDRWK